MSVFDPNFLSPGFATASAGYLSERAAGLPAVLSRLPRPHSKRETAIAAAVRDGIADPRRWDANRAPIVLKRRPGAGLPEWRDQ
jgi:hypothetical protein